MKIGVSGIQGDFREHKQMLERLGVEVLIVRKPEDLDEVDGLVIPGGESTTMIKIMRMVNLYEKLRERISNGFPVFGTCAGMILLSKEVVNFKQDSLKVIDIKVERNAYGRQVDSFETEIEIKGFKRPYKAVFIRAPKVVDYGNNVEVLSTYENSPILLRQKNVLVASFHPELTDDTRVHEYFLNMVK
ncbi:MULTISPECIES: pyridoxal 5'-phosphate synthase glutaminase subunit PdxT [unclassified Thermosipho (in: thermotogales)]|uniref:pyridoxal 5'-phosphate synthase glutaminase subunit PdxT n=1 Tax=unclassified Thermosipho (in: thermotogales) TaxID=2676525 RepID=UPI0009845D29|nr:MULTISPECIES: pyridoxal 5'-phosphate synthase glutaminase subunit PdxT [unclassified Thermosipho (in: thermotogales)]MBT1248412.1 glutamine amidotransferase [Thermosipho sp. 1244]OOC47540.1 glutamine amidotransferase [Thermosipho sp. 1223]